MAASAVKITDTTLRDGHQSLMATRLRLEDMVDIAPTMDAAGFDAMEVWGGATFDATTRFLGEDPWERLRVLKSLIPNTPLSMLLRGQSLVGYRAYANDVVDAFVSQSAAVGIDIFRVFDALNDTANVQRAAAAVKNAGKHLQMAICYSVTEEGRLGGPYYNLDYYLGKAKAYEALGADSICIKDMGGLLAPYDAYTLIGALKKAVDVPLQLHTHYTSGMAAMSVLKAIEAGVDGVDTCCAPLALRTAQPAIEPLLFALRGGDRELRIDFDKVLEIDDHFESVLPKYRRELQGARVAVIDARTLDHQIPGGMMSNLASQLREADAIDRLDEVLAEIPRTRRDMGYPPLVTPLSQMTGSQAVNNVLFGRYEMVTGPVRDYVAGKYGTPPGEVSPILRERALGDAPMEGADYSQLPPELDGARDAVKYISDNIEDALIYALYPTTGMTFLRIKHGLDPMPDEMKARADTDDDGAATAAVSQTDRERSPDTRVFNVYVDGAHFEVEVEPHADDSGAAIQIATARATTVARGRRSRRQTAANTTPTSEPRSQREASSASTAAVAANEVAVVAPIPGVVLRYAVEEGQPITEGDDFVVLEAMKMENTLPAPASGTVKALVADIGATVARDAVLAVIST
ncbi:MAG: pyruvate carboxylase subunit B [Chloroflexota bacterium]|nr:pyruvate carboxylase subunit B [Chloroflexota bacterium]